MQGYQITFFTQQDHRHEGRPVADWLIENARALGVHGATALLGAEGFGAHRRIHSARFFELADQPVEVTMIATVDETERLFAHLREQGVHVFYARSRGVFGTTGADEA